MDSIDSCIKTIFELFWLVAIPEHHDSNLIWKLVLWWHIRIQINSCTNFGCFLTFLDAISLKLKGIKCSHVCMMPLPKDTFFLAAKNTWLFSFYFSILCLGLRDSFVGRQNVKRNWVSIMLALFLQKDRLYFLNCQKCVKIMSLNVSDFQPSIGLFYEPTWILLACTGPMLGPFGYQRMSKRESLAFCHALRSMADCEIFRL